MRLRLWALSPAVLLIAQCGGTCTPGPVEPPPPVTVAEVCNVTNAAETGAGTLRDCLAGQAPTIVFQVPYLELTSTVQVQRPVVIRGEVEIVNVNAGDGFMVQAPNVELRDFHIRGAGPGFSDIAAYGADNLSMIDISVGMSPRNHYTLPESHRTLGSTTRIYDSRNLTIYSSSFGWNRFAYGNVIVWNVDGARIEENYIVGSSYGELPVQTLDQLTLAGGTRNVLVLNNTIDLSTSSSAIEMHTASNITIIGNRLTRAARAGITVFDVDGAVIENNYIAESGTCGVPSAVPIALYHTGDGISTDIRIGANDIYPIAC